MNKVLKGDNIERHSVENLDKLVINERIISNLKNRKHKFIITISKNIHTDRLTNTVDDSHCKS